MSVKKRFMEALRHFRKNWRLHPILYLFDILFFATSFFVFLSIQYKMVQYLEVLSQKIGEGMAQLSASAELNAQIIDTSALTSILSSDPEISLVLTKMIILFIGLITVLSLLWCVFQGINWTITHHAIKKLDSPVKYFLRFIGINVIWFIFLYILVYIWFNITVYNLKSFIPLMPQAILNILAFALFLILAYFIVISYVLAKHKQNFKIIGYAFMHGTKYIVDMVVMFLVMLLMLLVTFLISYFLSSISIILALVVMVVLFIPVLTLIRFFAILSVEDILKEDLKI